MSRVRVRPIRSRPACPTPSFASMPRALSWLRTQAPSRSTTSRGGRGRSGSGAVGGGWQAAAPHGRAVPPPGGPSARPRSGSSRPTAARRAPAPRRGPPAGTGQLAPPLAANSHSAGVPRPLPSTGASTASSGGKWCPHARQHTRCRGRQTGPKTVSSWRGLLPAGRHAVPGRLGTTAAGAVPPAPTRPAPTPRAGSPAPRCGPPPPTGPDPAAHLAAPTDTRSPVPRRSPARSRSPTNAWQRDPLAASCPVIAFWLHPGCAQELSE